MTKYVEGMDSQDLIKELVDGNPTASFAIAVIMSGVGSEFEAKPEQFGSASEEEALLSSLHILDRLEIYGADISVLYNDVAGKDPLTAWYVLKAADEGTLDVKAAIEAGEPVELDAGLEAERQEVADAKIFAALRGAGFEI